jgi:transposase
MYLIPSKPTEGKIIYIAKSFRTKTGSTSTKNVRRLGTLEEIRQREGVADAWAWAKSEVEKENSIDAEGRRSVNIRLMPDKLLDMGRQQSFNLGYLILNKIYYELGIDRICEGMTRRGEFKFDLNEILRQLVFCRILWPASKLETWKLAPRLALAKPMQLHQIYRALVVIEQNMDYLQERLFHYSKDLLQRNTSVIYYDCTNFFYESTVETALRKPGASKENRRTPIVQMGIFMDADGLPLAFNINPGNTNEQTTLQPLEKMIGERMNIEEFIMCTDAGLASAGNRLYNDTDNRRFITVQSVKTLPNTEGKKQSSGRIKDWALSSDGWHLPNDPTTIYTLDEIMAPENRDAYYDKIFYKERWYPTWVRDGKGADRKLEQRCIVSFSIKYLEYQRQTRQRNIEKAEKAIHNGNAGESSKNFRSLIISDKCTADGEIAEIDAGYRIDRERIAADEQYDGFYAICTNLAEYTDHSGRTYHTIPDLIKINHARWEIEESFRIMKTQMRARPVYHRTDRAIKAHFAICFVALFLYRVLEHRLDSYTTDNILGSLKEMNALHIQSEGYIPTFTRTDLTDKLFSISGFRLDNQIILLKKLKSIIKQTKAPI